MNARLLALGALLAGAAATSLPAQGAQPDPQCQGTGPFGFGGDACQKAVDLFAYMMPQLGTLVAGGNATLGQGGAVGGLGHFAVSVRGNALLGSFPNLDEVGVAASDPQSSQYNVKSGFVGLPSVDASIGVFKGLPLGVTNVGGVDLLASVAYLPDVSQGAVQMTLPEGSLKIGYGARIGILQESLISPGLSLTLLKRDLPRMDVTADAGNGQTIALTSFDVKTTAWRVVASKSLLMFGLAAGYGRDRYQSAATLDYTVADPTNPGTYLDGDPIAVGQDMTRTNMFLDLSMNLLLLKIVGQVGRVSGGEVSTYNQYSTPADAARLYGAVGLRMGF